MYTNIVISEGELVRERKTQNRRKYTKNPTKPQILENCEPFHFFFFTTKGRKPPSHPSPKAAKNVNPTHVPYLRTSLCKAVLSDSGDSKNQ